MSRHISVCAKFTVYSIPLILLFSISGGLRDAKAAFAPINGTYNGLFFETNGVWQQSSGAITVTTTTRGTYTARLQLGRSRYVLSGFLDANGRVSRDILRRFQVPLTLQFQVDPGDPDLIVGSLAADSWTAELFADRSVYNTRSNICPDTGQYTMGILGDFTSTNSPGGASFGTINIDKVGRIRFIGFLSDGTKVIQSATVSKNGQWALHAPLYGGGGTLYGWLLFNSSTNEDLSGEITWIRPEIPWAWYYPGGFALIDSVTGSRYLRPPKATKVLNFTTGTVEFNGGNLERGITNRITIDSNNRLQNLSANTLRLTFSLSNGSFAGSVMDPISWARIPFKGVLLQKQGIAVGYFPGWDQTGEVWLQGDQTPTLD